MEMISEFDIYISWSRPKKRKEKVYEDDDDDVDLPNLMNLKKIANKYRGSA